VGELRDLDLKRLLLQETVQVGIDLYSGKLTVSDEELANYKSQAARTDELRTAEPAEPIRIVLIGQTSTGKSSVVNALTDVLQAEVDVLPVTDQLTVHELKIDDQAIASLIDTPGIDGTDDTFEQLLNAALEADLIIWLTKATQPARAPDKQLLAAMQAHFDKQTNKLPPPLIMALSHIDQLSPKSEWNPPYDLQSEQPKAQSIAAALKSVQTAIGFPDTTLAVPVYVGKAHAAYNVDALASQIMMLTDTSTNVQLNRRRLELSSNAQDWRARWRQTKKLGTVLGQSVMKRVRK